jgi:hypothetical protein
MAATIPSLTRKIDTIFTTTWYEMQRKATDNILVANVVSAMLKELGCFKTQSGGKYIERTVRYGVKTAYNLAKGDVLPTGEDDLETAALFKWAWTGVSIQRSLQDDAMNWGTGRIKELVKTKIDAAHDALNTKFEDSFLASVDATTAGGTELRAARDPYSLWNFLPDLPATGDLPVATYVPTTAGSYTYGGIDVGGLQTIANIGTVNPGTLNAWWQGKYKYFTNPMIQNLEDQLRTAYNYTTQGGKDQPDCILMNQAMFEAAEDLFGGKVQIVHQGESDSPAGRMVKLGYPNLVYKNAHVYWTPNSLMTAGTALILNSKWIDVVYDPGLWFSMRDWQELPNQLERVTHIVCMWSGPFCYQLRRQARLGTYTA